MEALWRFHARILQVLDLLQPRCFARAQERQTNYRRRDERKEKETTGPETGLYERCSEERMRRANKQWDEETGTVPQKSF